MAQLPNNKNNEAFIDRIYIVKVPYCLRVSDEIKIYDKLLANSSLSRAHCAPDTLKMLAQFSVLSRLKEPENSNIYSKMRVYDGENLKDTDPKAKSIQEYRDAAGVDEGMNGLSTRFAFKILSKVFNFDPMRSPPTRCTCSTCWSSRSSRNSSRRGARALPALHQEYLAPRYIEFIGKEIQTAYLESYSEYRQNIFDRYVLYADFWIQDQEYRDPETGEILNRVATRSWKDREASRHQQPEGFPQRDRQLRAARPQTTTARTRRGCPTRSCAW